MIFFFFLFSLFTNSSKYNAKAAYGISCPFMGMTCIAPFTDGSYYRARVLSIVETQNPGKIILFPLFPPTPCIIYWENAWESCSYLSGLQNFALFWYMLVCGMYIR